MPLEWRIYWEECYWDIIGYCKFKNNYSFIDDGRRRKLARNQENLRNFFVPQTKQLKYCVSRKNKNPDVDHRPEQLGGKHP